NRLVAELAAHSDLAGPGGELYPGVRYVPPGREAAFLAPFPVTSLPEVDPDTLLAFQVLGLKTVEHLTRISEKAFEKRFGPLGRRLACYARGRDNRPVSPVAQAPAMRAVKRCDDDAIDGLEPDQALSRLIDLLAVDLSDALREKHLAGRLVVLLVRAQRNSAVREARLRILGAENSRPPMRVGLRPASFGSADETHPSAEAGRQQRAMNMAQSPDEQHSSAEAGRQRPAVDISGTAEKTESRDQFFPNQDSRIHSMLPQPPQPGMGRSLTSSGSKSRALTTHDSQTRNSQTRNSPSRDSGLADSRLPDSLPGTTVRVLARMATGRPVNDRRTLSELGHRLLLRVLAEQSAPELVVAAGAELCLEISHFAPPEQMLLPGLDGRPTDKRLERLYRQENILAARFGATPFRHLAAVDLDSVLSERIFRWGAGMN
ncbi:MAG TPA: hypothetical protein VG815_13465, partial [Chloroflexota bacterium]|nr:hypothetical protein [Chloroflexota bacterium]